MAESEHHGRVALADDEDGFARRFDPSDDLLHVVVPDDLRELDAEVADYCRELEIARRQRRRQQLRRKVTPRWAHGGLPSPIFTAVLLIVATTGLLLSVFAPVTQRARQEFSSTGLGRPAQRPGEVGGLLPDVSLMSNRGPIGSRVIRPAIYVLVPAGCDCANAIRQIVGQADEVSPGLYTPLVSVGTDHTAAKLAAAKDGGRGIPSAFRDEAGVLARTYHASTTLPTLLLVTGDGTLTTPPRVFHSGDRLESALTALHS